MAAGAWNAPMFQAAAERPFFHCAERAVFRIAAEGLTLARNHSIHGLPAADRNIGILVARQTVEAGDSHPI